jgi:serine/threonine protein phosphatase PrpC
LGPFPLVNEFNTLLAISTNSFYKRHVSDVSNISYSGYLLKRSNRPYVAVSPFPSATDSIVDQVDDNNNGVGRARLSASPHSSNGNMMMMMDPIFSSKSEAAPEPDWSTPTHAPQHLLLEAINKNTAAPTTDDELNHHAKVEVSNHNKQTEEEEKQTLRHAAVENSLQFAANFFGVELPTAPSEKDQNSTPRELASSRSLSMPAISLPAANSTSTMSSNISECPSSPPSRRIPRSSPIKMVTSPIKMVAAESTTPSRQQPSLMQNSESNQTGNASFLYSRQSSLPPPSRSISDVGCQPVDTIDPADGHIWRSKYCVLEDGVLYFYRHQADAETPQAHAERQEPEVSQPEQKSAEDVGRNRNSNSNLNYADLGKSPMPRSRLLFAASKDNTNDESDDGDSDGAAMRGPIWEKRVELDGVGAVRSAEMEFGGNSFELAAADEDSDDKLVLRARNSMEMNEWLFQFHRSIATFVMNIMDHVGSVPRSNLGDLHHPKPQSEHKPESAYKPLSPDRSAAIVAFSPRYQKILTTTTPSLSHGHGRSALHRRRVDGLTRAAATFESPEPPLMPFSATAQDESAPSIRSRMVTPVVPSTVRRLPVVRNEEVNILPELSDRQSNSPETERPPPSEILSNLDGDTGKYIPLQLRNGSADASTPAPSGGKYVPPHLRNKTASKKYVPPHLRNSAQSSPQDQYALHPRPEPYSGVSATMEATFIEPEMIKEEKDFSRFKRGGCADPTVVVGSVRDTVYVPRKASRLGKVRTDPFGCFSDTESNAGYSSALRWEIGAVSECGVRESNEDSYLIASNLSTALDQDQDGELHTTIWSESTQHPTGLFAVFDGHCGDQASRFAAEKLPSFICEESKLNDDPELDIPPGCSPSRVQDILHKAMIKLDKEFCDLCVEEGRVWESGTTALVAMLAEEHLIVGNLGDARGIISRSVADPQKVPAMEEAGWNALPIDDHYGDRGCLWKEVTETHSPSRTDERERIEKANGWITTETEIPIGQLQRMVLFDEDVIDILKRCFSDRYQPSPKASAPQRILHISRVCGELAVSRAIGDRDFKAAFNPPGPSSGDDESWACPVMLPFPDDRSRYFVGDLVSSTPDFLAFPIGEEGVSDEFLLLACDGLWDVIDAEDAVRVTRDLLFEKQWPAKKAAARLAELAIHLGSSDNITVIVVRFFNRQN